MWAGLCGERSRRRSRPSTTTSRATTAPAGIVLSRCWSRTVSPSCWRRPLAPLDHDYRDLVGGSVDAISRILQVPVDLERLENLAYRRFAVETAADRLVIKAVVQFISV